MCRIGLPPALFTCLALGCAHEGPPLAEVTGEVSFNGLPARAEIIFEPVSGGEQTGGRPSSAFADSNGSFRLQYTADRSGAVIGLHRVLVKILRTQNPEGPKSFLEAVTPVKIARMDREVHAGKNHFHFAVTF